MDGHTPTPYGPQPCPHEWIGEHITEGHDEIECEDCKKLLLIGWETVHIDDIDDGCLSVEWYIIEVVE